MVREGLVLALVSAALAIALAFLAYLLVTMKVSLLYAMALDGAIVSIAGVVVYALKSAWDTTEFNIMLQLYLEKLRFSEDARDRLALRRAETIAEGLLRKNLKRGNVIIVGDTVIIKHGGDGE